MFLTPDNHKIIIIGGLLLMGLTLITGVAVYSVMHQQIASSLGRGLAVALQGKGHLLESQIEKGLSDTHALAMRPFMIQSIQQLNVQPYSNRALSDLERNVHSLTQTGFSAAIVYDKKGNKLSAAGQFSENQSQSLWLNKKSDTFLIWDEEFILHTSKAVYDQDGQRIGSITTESTLPQLTRSFNEIRTIGETGTFMLCAPPNDISQKMACLISQVDGVKFKYLKRVVEGGVLPMDQALNGKSGVIAVKDYRQIQVIEAYAPLDATGMGMILKLDEAELLRPVAEELKIIILYLAGLIIAEILLLNWFIRKLINSEREAQNAKEKAEQYSVDLGLKESELRERLKEITCLHEIRRSIGMELSVENVCNQIFNHLIPAMQYPESASVVIEIDGKILTSKSFNHEPVRDPTHKLKSNIEVNGNVCGQLSVLYPVNKPFLILEEQRLIDAITSDLARWLERKQVDELLHIRLKEITCLYEIRRNMGLELSVDEVCQNIFGYLIPALQFPEIAIVTIELNGKQFTSPKYYQYSANQTFSEINRKSKVCFDCYKQGDIIGSVIRSNISINDKICGSLTVSYPEDQPFLILEEKRLIGAITVDFSRWLERKQVDEALRERLKEITCLYGIRRGMGLELSIDNVCQNIFENLIPAVQFPEIASAVIEINDWRFTSGKYVEGRLVSPFKSKKNITHEIRGPWRTDRDSACTCYVEINVNGKTCGQLRVFYPEDKPYLVPEEQKLVNAIASDLESWLERKRLEQTLVFVAEEQAHTIGQELHDNLGQQIAAIGYQVRALEKKIAASGNQDMATVAASIAAQVQTAVIQIKQLAQGLLPFELEANGLIAALEKLATRIATTYSITCDFLCDNEIKINDKNIALNIYRIAQEAANNAIRHGGAQHLSLSLKIKGKNLFLSICDDGCGFVVETKHGETQGMGIKIMQYRAKQLGAKLKFLSPAEGGAQVCLEMRMV
ncbi:Histidine kinase [Nitrosomonas aestuarii]|uniref:histidine kinase n=1 Tax=Nitrosomonas aestuarii TaxID=52441 RepID=A0A1I4A434_9PROT|nr:ATP-binding protein [Nitrosomonas aestuarii]SFK50636.1 Histidine kinase [Nitrosomonas aestuarii]